MRAVLFDDFGSEDVLRIGEAKSPALPADSLRIRVRAAGVNRADLLQREGHYPPPPGASPILGMECAGEVIETGADVAGWTIGDRAMALLPGGGYAEEAVVHHGSAMHMPDLLSDEEAAETLLAAFLDVVGVERVVLVGNSIGGATALRYAAHVPERVAGLVVENPGGLDRNDDPIASRAGSDTWGPATSAPDATSRRDFLKTSAGLASGAAAAPYLSASAHAQGAGATDAELARLQGARRVLIKGGVVLSLDRQVGDFAQADVLIEDGKIREVRPNIAA